MATLHAHWFYVAVASTGLVGLWGVLLAALRRPPDRWFRMAAGAAVVAMLAQVGFGLILYAQGLRAGSDFHMFYGFVILFVFAGAYIFRAQISRRPAVVWGLMLLFVMGLGLRAWANVGG